MCTIPGLKMKILGIETSMYAGSIAVSEDDKVLGEYYFNTGPSHSEKLLPSIDWLLKELSIDKNELGGIVVSLGPGSFTSLRIGLASAKGLSYALGIPIAGVSTLELMANNLPFTPFKVCPVIDAKRGEVFAAFFESQEGRVVRISEDMVLSPQKLAGKIKSKTVFIGEGALLYSDFLEDIMVEDGCVAFCPEALNYPRAGVLSPMGYLIIKDGGGDDPHTLAPHYMRKSEAELSKESSKKDQSERN